MSAVNFRYLKKLLQAVTALKSELLAPKSLLFSNLKCRVLMNCSHKERKGV